MKSDHRHDLKTNELADWLGHLPQWINENSKTIIYVCAVLVAAVGLYIYQGYKARGVSGEQTQLSRLVTEVRRSKPRIVQSQVQGFDISYNLLKSSESLDSIAKSTKNEYSAAISLLKSADAIRSELHYRPDSPTSEELRRQIDKARTKYEQAAGKAKGSSSLLSFAKFGLGLCAEELGNFDAAEAIYSQITSDEQLEGTVAYEQAKQRLSVMDEFKELVIFVPKPQPQIEQPIFEMREVEGDVLLESKNNETRDSKVNSDTP